MDNKEIINLYLKITSETRSKLTAISVIAIGTIIANDFFNSFLNTCQIKGLKLAFVFYFLTMSLEVLSGYIKARHYSLYIDGNSSSIDYRATFWGKLAECFFWLSLILFTIATLIFIILMCL